MRIQITPAGKAVNKSKHPGWIILLLLLITGSMAPGETDSRSFELRYVTPDPAADGETDFKGPTEVFDTPQRVKFLEQYAQAAKQFWDVPALDEKVVTDAEAQAAVRAIKPQPVPSVRKHIPLKEWKWLGCADGDADRDTLKLARWAHIEDVDIEDGQLVIKASAEPIRWRFPSQSWRSSITWQARVTDGGGACEFRFSDKEILNAVRLGFGADGHFFYTTADNVRVIGPAYSADQWYTFKVEFDFAAEKRQKDLIRYNLYINDELVADYVPMERVVTTGVGYASNFTSLPFVNTLTVTTDRELRLDDLWGIGYALTGRESYPYTTETFLDENFESKPAIAGWLDEDYDDGDWPTGALPLAHGGERHAGEDLYLRTEVEVGDFDKAFLNLETLDPSGEVYVNGKIVAAVHKRYPQRLDISQFLRRNAPNRVAIKVNAFYLTEQVGEIMPHTPLDFNFGWFAGRASIDLVPRTHIVDGFLFTRNIDADGTALLQVRSELDNQHWTSFKGSLQVRLTPWFPKEAERPILQESTPVQLGNGPETIEMSLRLPRAELWTPEDPKLYKVEFILCDETGNPIDDWVCTTGVRTVGQKDSQFLLNGKAAMANGAQVFGFRSPIETTIRDSRRAPAYWIAKEILMIQKMNGNLLRTHVHGWEFPARGINDPRYAEFADQLGMLLIWCPTSWIRTGRGWGDIDFVGYPQDMRQVRNHPSIIIWELANHTQSFKGRPYSESNIYVEKAYETVYPVDPSRLISYNSFVQHMHYGNDAGTIDYQGNPMVPSPFWTAPMVTRGNQDSPTGYGKTWDILREWPSEHLADLLQSPDRAYFNFEHQESMAQPNWTLVKGKPWYRLHSYEWDYDVGSIGRRLSLDEWETSQAWQAFSAWEAIKKMRWLDYDGFSWCCLHGGMNSVTYKKPLIDFHDHAKLAFYANRMAFQKTVAGSRDVDVAYGPGDVIQPVIMHWGEAATADLEVIIHTPAGKEIAARKYRNISLPQGRKAINMEPFAPPIREAGYWIIEYRLKIR